jgi:hypothetical protein
VGDLLRHDNGQAQANEMPQPTQALLQTSVELQQTWKWAARLIEFFAVEVMAIAAWWVVFRKRIRQALFRWETAAPVKTNVALVLGLAAGSLGFHPQGPYAIRLVDINSAAYYTLAQNPVLYAGEALRAAVDSRLQEGSLPSFRSMPLREAIDITRQTLGEDAIFPHQRFPLVRQRLGGSMTALDRPANVLLIFIEGLDRRYLNHMVRGLRLTPFLDHLKAETVYFQNFFANGVQTSRGLFASLCSYYPRHGNSAMKTRYTHDYLCLPSVLRKAGYRTEMVIGQHRDINRLHLFMSRNGLHQLFDESDFPEGAERQGLGLTDQALFEFLRGRIETLQASGRPFFLTTLTLGTHHPFTVPGLHPEVAALQAESDAYLAALRYADLELERFFTGLTRDGLLNNTVVFILGDHGRHEPVGANEVEKLAGHFLTPLFIWMDEPLRAPLNYRARIVQGVASQVDLAPTILAMNGLMPREAPFLGRDLSCALATDCLEDNQAFLSSVYDDLIGLADREGLSLYSLRTEMFYQTDLAAQGPTVRTRATDPAIVSRYRRMMALHISSNILLDRNMIWSWKELGDKL